ncbi:hypothetical protein, partial [Phenylobacterium sp.]|uniref:hypothetical protein n=1 Tax=Phenylobacterium sp. TaxID=1871053 RepID=UPI002F425848
MRTLSIKALRRYGLATAAAFCLALGPAAPAWADWPITVAPGDVRTGCTELAGSTNIACSAPIRGQTGIAGGAGSTSASTTRVVPATDAYLAVQGRVAEGVAPVGGPVVIGGWDGTVVHTIGAYTPGDAFSAGPYGIATSGRNMVYNGTSWDMQRAAAHGYNATGIGLTAAALTAEVDEVSPTTVTENQFGTARMSAARFLYSAPISGQDGVAGGSGATTANTTRTTTASDSPEMALTGAVTETAASTDTSSSGLNGRLQRIAQRLSSVLAKQPALGTAGTASADVITVQGAASMTPIAIASTVANPATTLTRPADTTAYAANDLVASSTTAGSVTVPSFTATRVAAGSFRVAELRLASNHTTGLSGVQVTVR